MDLTRRVDTFNEGVVNSTTVKLEISAAAAAKICVLTKSVVRELITDVLKLKEPVEKLSTAKEEIQPCAVYNSMVDTTAGANDAVVSVDVVISCAVIVCVLITEVLRA